MNKHASDNLTHTSKALNFQIIKAAVFDLDGTLVDTAPDLVAATNQTLIDNGYTPLSYDSLKHASSHGSVALLKAALPDMQEEEIKGLVPQFFMHYSKVNGKNARVFSGIIPLLDMFKTNNVRLGIVTNKPAQFVHLLLKKLNLSNYFDSIISGDSTKYAKPHTAPMKLAAQQLNIPCNKIVYFGDAERDILAANNAEMHSVLALWGYISATDTPSLWQANLSFSTPSEAMSYFCTKEGQS